MPWQKLVANPEGLPNKGVFPLKFWCRKAFFTGIVPQHRHAQPTARVGCL